MTPELLKEWLPFFQAAADKKQLQMEFQHYKGSAPEFIEWVDIDLDWLFHKINGELRLDCIRVKPREFKNFALPWDFIDKQWNYATYARSHDGIIVYESRPIFVEASKTDTGANIRAGWGSKLCAWLPIIPTQEGINEIDWLACRNEE